MTDLSGITVTAGILDPARKEALGATLERIGGKMIDSVRIDTTHFVCAEGRGPLWEKAVEMNIPVVVPEWVDACESEGTIAGVRGYYLNADPKARQLGVIHGSSHQRTTSTMSAATTAQGRPSTQPQRSEPEQPPAEPPLTPFPGGETTQPQAKTEEVESQEEEEAPPPPPPKNESDAEKNAEETAEETAETSQQNGHAEPAPESEKLEEIPVQADDAEEESKESTLPQHKPEGDELSPKVKGKEGEGDFSEVTL